MIGDKYAVRVKGNRMSNFLGHHHELRIPAMETIADLTKLIFHNKDGEIASNNEAEDETINPIHTSHRPIHSKPKRHHHAGPKGSVIEIFGITGNNIEDAQSTHHTSEISHEIEQVTRIEIHAPKRKWKIHVNRIREIYLEERRKIDEIQSQIIENSEIVQSTSDDSASVDIDDIFTEKRVIRKFVEKKVNSYLFDIDESGETTMVPRSLSETNALPHGSTENKFDGTHFRKRFMQHTLGSTEKSSHVVSHLPQKSHSSEIHSRHIPANKIHQSKGFDGNALRKKFLENQ